MAAMKSILSAAASGHQQKDRVVDSFVVRHAFFRSSRPLVFAHRAAVDVVRRAGAVDRVCFGSFGWRVLRAVRALEPSVATSAAREEVRWALYRSWCGLPVRRPSYSGYQVPECAGRTRVVSPRFV